MILHIICSNVADVTDFVLIIIVDIEDKGFRKLIESGVSVFSFHTRADKVSGGVNDSLCDLLGMFDTRAFGEGELGATANLEHVSCPGKRLP